MVNVSGQEQRQPHLHHRGAADTLLVRAPGSHAAQCDAFRRPSQNLGETLRQIELLVIFRHHQTQDECRIAIGDQVAAKLLHAAPARSQGNMAHAVYRFCSRTRRGPDLEGQLLTQQDARRMAGRGVLMSATESRGNSVRILSPGE